MFILMYYFEIETKLWCFPNRYFQIHHHRNIYGTETLVRRTAPSNLLWNGFMKDRTTSVSANDNYSYSNSKIAYLVVPVLQIRRLKADS
jgi:hypothetical protein